MSQSPESPSPDTHPDQRTVVVTGASDGIGAVAAQRLSEAGDRVLVVGRNPEKTRRVAERIGAESFVADFASLDDVRRLAGELTAATDRIDVLLNNAGGTFSPATRTGDGHEPNFQINHLGPFLLTHLLHQQLAAAPAARVINTSSIANLAGRVDLDDLDWRRRTPREPITYGTSKLMNILFTRGLAQRWAGDGIVSAAVHPGAVASSFGRDSFLVGLLYRTPLRHVGAITPEAGAAPLVALATNIDDINGQYFHRHRRGGPQSRQARDQRLVDGLWEASAKIVGL